MDSTLIVSIIIAIVAIVPGVWALVNQARKDKVQAQMDMNKAAQDAAVSIIAPLQTEVARLQARVIELEKALIDKTTEIGNLMQAGIDKDTKIRTLEYNLEGMRLRLEAFETKRKSPKPKTSEEVESRLEEELKSDEAKKEEIKIYTNKAIEQITNGSVANHTEVEE